MRTAAVAAVYDRRQSSNLHIGGGHRPPLLLILLCLLFCLSSACKVGPKYKTPTAPVPPAFKEPLPSNWKTANPQDGTLRGDWWTIFGDSQLNDLETQVNISNQSVAVAEAQFRGARAAV